MTRSNWKYNIISLSSQSDFPIIETVISIDIDSSDIISITDPDPSTIIPINLNLYRLWSLIFTPLINHCGKNYDFMMTLMKWYPNNIHLEEEFIHMIFVYHYYSKRNSIWVIKINIFINIVKTMTSSYHHIWYFHIN